MKTEADRYRIREASWEVDGEALRGVRHAVFVVEQHVPLELEWDGIDPTCRHVIAEDTKGKAIATGRLLPDGHIGRMAVIREWRQRGVGSSVLLWLVGLAQQLGFDTVALHAQTTAIDFYRRHGFVAFGEPFDDAGILHRAMKREMQSPLQRPSP